MVRIIPPTCPDIGRIEPRYAACSAAYKPDMNRMWAGLDQNVTSWYPEILLKEDRQKLDLSPWGVGSLEGGRVHVQDGRLETAWEFQLSNIDWCRLG